MGINEFILLMFSNKKVLVKVTVVSFMLVERRIEVMGRRGRRLKQLSGKLKERRGYRKLKNEALDSTLWRTRFGRGYDPVVGPG